MSTEQTPSSEIQMAKIKASLVMVATAGSVTASLDVFASWLLAGGGAFLALMLSQAKNLESTVPISAVAHSAQLYLWAVGFGVIGRYLAAGVGASVSASEKAMKAFDNFVTEKPQEFLTLFFAEMKTAYPWPWHYLVSNAFNKVLAGDLTYSGRLLINIAVWHSLFVFGLTILLLFSLGGTVAAIKVGPP